jgi:hypothetical protein
MSYRTSSFDVNDTLSQASRALVARSEFQGVKAA